MASIFFRRWGSTKGPFFKLLVMAKYWLGVLVSRFGVLVQVLAVYLVNCVLVGCVLIEYVLSGLFALAPATDNQVAGFFLRVAGATFGLPPRRHGMSTA